jgi:rare lipoprotein A
MIILIGIIIIFDGIWSLLTMHNKHYPWCPWYIEAGRIARAIFGIILIAAALILRFGYNIAWAGPEKSSYQAQTAYQKPGSTPGHLLFNSGIKTNRGNSLVGSCGWYAKNDPTDPWVHTITASKEKFDENSFSCAMRNRSFGKYYRVTNLANGRSVIVKHNDFGPAREYKGRKLNRVMDLTKAAFNRIADLDAGVIRVRIKEL